MYAAFVVLAIPVWTQDPPAPATDRVGFPEGYRERYKVLRTSEQPEKQQVKVIYGNEAAASQSQGAFADGSVLVMETTQKGVVTGMHVMRKQKGFGEAYGPNRTGEWEYAEYRPDRSYITTPQKSFACAACHLKASAAKDFVYDAGRGSASPAKR